jgi:hypothetical protein
MPETGLIFYNLDLRIAFVFLFAILACAAEAGRLARRRAGVSGRWMVDASDFTSSTILGLLALLLGFTFSMAIARYESRKNLVIREANALGTALLRARLVEPGEGKAIREGLREYLRGRLRGPNGSDETNRAQEAIWQAATRLTERDRSAVASSLIGALNEAFDLRAEADFMANNRVPEAVFLVIVLVAAAGLAAQDHGRASGIVLSLLLALVIVLIQDLDRPGNGLIRVGAESLAALQKDFR